MEKSKLSKTIIFLLLLVTTSTFSQSRFKTAFLDNLYFGFGFDPAMALNGPQHNYENKPSTFHWHAEFGWDIDFDENNGLRISLGGSKHHEINYSKVTIPRIEYKAVDHLVIWPVDNFNSYLGIELSTIWRTDIPYKVNSGGSGQTFYNNPESVSAGITAEIQFQKGHFGVGLKWASFIAEGVLIQDNKFVRHEGTFMVFYHLTNREGKL